MVVIFSRDGIGDALGRARIEAVQIEKLTTITAVRCNGRSMIGCEDNGRQRIGSCRYYVRKEDAGR